MSNTNSVNGRAGEAGEELPVLPGVVMSVTKIASDPNSSVSDLARVIEQDPGLSARVLQAVNSPYYSPRSKIATAQRAVSFMGMHAVKNLVLCLAARRLFVIKADYPLDVFWENALRLGCAARSIARRARLPQPEEVFTMGLFQDLGLLVRLQQAPELGPAFAAAAHMPAHLRLEVERQHGAGHDELGYATLAGWGLPDSLVVPLRFHHRPDEAPEHMERARVASAAEAVADLMLVDDKQEAMNRLEEHLSAVGLDADAVGEVVRETSDSTLAFFSSREREEIARVKAREGFCAGVFDIHRAQNPPSNAESRDFGRSQQEKMPKSSQCWSPTRPICSRSPSRSSHRSRRSRPWPARACSRSTCPTNH